MFFLRSRTLNVLVLSLLAATSASAQQPFRLASGDRVVILGNALIEHERFHGYLESRLRRHVPTAKLVVRNLGWAGDTVRGSARTSGYKNPEGKARLLKETKDWEPTVVFLGYGMNESFAGAAGIPDFLNDYRRLLDDIGGLKARVVILSPTPHEDLGRPLPDPTAHNATLEQYVAALRGLAEERGLPFVDLFHPLKSAKGRLTSNGILLNELGYWHLAAAVDARLAPGVADDRMEFRWTGKSFEPKLLPASPPPGTNRGKIRLVIDGLPAGRRAVSLSGTTLAAADAREWQAGVALDASPLADDVEAWRRAIVARNDLFFRGWRPFNDHSRHWSFMAKDFARFAELTRQQDEVIDALPAARGESLSIVR